jgi:predicted RNase H-like HicB family nuclease
MNDIESIVSEIMNRPYSRILIPQDEGGFSAEILEFAGCFAEGESADETYRNLEQAARGWVEATLAKGEPVPLPLTNYEVSGKFALRLPRGLYARAAKIATKEGVSLNQFIVDAVAERTGEISSLHRLEDLFSKARTVTFHIQTVRFDRESVSTEPHTLRCLPNRLSIETSAANLSDMRRN